MKTLCLIASFICITLHVIADQDTLFFNPQPEDITAVEGYNATIKCGASSKQNVTFSWTLDGVRLENDTRRHMVGSNLYISRVSPLYDIGEFKCVATNVTTGRSIISRGAQINILWITDVVTVIPTESSLEPKVGGELILRCKSEGNPEPQVTWYHNGEKLFRGEKVSLKANQLHIVDLTLHDNGVYSCRIINDVGSINSSENYALRLSDSQSPRITVIPQSLVVKENDSAVFDCIFENAASTDWYFESTENQISNDSRYVIYPNGTLKIMVMSNDLVGLYKCQGKSKKPLEVPHQNYVAELQIAYIDDFLDAFDPHLNADQSAVVTVHEPYDVTCLKPKGLPRPKMWWEDPKGHVINDSGRTYVQDMRLIFSEVQKPDAGEYTCVAENIAGQHRKRFNLFVSAAPVVLRHPGDITTNEGENARFECSYSNSSSTTVVWLKDDMYIKETGSHIVFNKNNGTLIIRNTSPSDAGLYQCEIRSADFPPVHSNPASLTVKEKLKFIPAPVSKKLELGSNAKIYCKAGGSTPPLVNWTRTDSPSPEWPPHIKDDNGTLHFNRVLSTDTGKYMCIARNSQGIINATIDLDVIVMPKFSVQPSDTVANEGEPVILHCLAEGDPLPIIQWDKNNELNGFNQARFKVLENGSLFASEVHVDDEGKYGCTAGNSGGLRRHEVSLTVRSKEFPNRIGRGGFGNDGENTMTKTVAITLGAAGVYIVLVVSLMMWCRYRRARRKALMLAQATADAENSEVIHDMELKDRTPQKNRCNEVIANDESVDSKNQSLNKLHFPRENLSTVMLLGHGEYGQVFLAKAKGIIEENTDTVVMVKALESKDENIHSEFRKDISMYLKMKHENVGKVLRVCQEADPHYMIMDYTDWGDLKQFLLATRPEEITKGPKQSPLSIPQNLMICQQVAVGMDYVAKQQFFHKDLAARNCLISSSLKIKISCPCLSLDTYSQEYYQYKSKVIPLRWASPEAVIGDSWSIKSDVWSFAVLIWEVFHKAELPFSDLSNDEVMQKLQAKELKISLPNDAPDSLVKLIDKCWSPNPNDRPTFSEIVTVFVELSVAVQV